MRLQLICAALFGWRCDKCALGVHFGGQCWQPISTVTCALAPRMVRAATERAQRRSRSRRKNERRVH